MTCRHVCRFGANKNSTRHQYFQPKHLESVAFGDDDKADKAEWADVADGAIGAVMLAGVFFSS